MGAFRFNKIRSKIYKKTKYYPALSIASDITLNT